MSSQAEEFTIGVEEEYQIINPTTRELRRACGTRSPKSPESPWLGGTARSPAIADRNWYAHL
nr:hypothetical protein [Nostoc sp. ChiSLP03a]MDZ8212681.1 hypothetical protein [Nostoc sp. ChiSLP03a]